MGIDTIGDHTKGSEIPKLARRGVAAAATKKQLLEICHLGGSIQKLKGLDWEFVEGRHGYTSDLDLSKQIAF